MPIAGALWRVQISIRHGETVGIRFFHVYVYARQVSTLIFSPHTCRHRQRQCIRQSPVRVQGKSEEARCALVCTSVHGDIVCQRHLTPFTWHSRVFFFVVVLCNQELVFDVTQRKRGHYDPSFAAHVYKKKTPCLWSLQYTMPELMRRIIRKSQIKFARQ